MFESLCHHLDCVDNYAHLDIVHEIENDVLSTLHLEPIHDLHTNEWEDLYHV